jgi:hypothetical protein
MKVILMSIVMSMAGAEMALHAHTEWTWVSKKKFSEQEQQHNGAKKEVVFSSTQKKPFTQLIFSWNAIRPREGFLSFYVQVRDARTKQWGKWHKMVDWGKNVQRSYLHDTHPHAPQYLYVRLEMPSGKYADAFHIKSEACNGASLALLKGFAVNTADMNKFSSEAGRHQQLPSVFITGVPRYSQFMVNHPRNDELCSPTSCSMLVSFLLKRPINPLSFAHHSYDHGLGVHGSWPFNMAHAFEQGNEKIWFWTVRFKQFSELHAQLCRGIPVVVSVRGPLPGSASPYANGHLLVVVGWDRKRQEVICHDPAFKNTGEVKVHYKRSDFLTAWERSRRLGYCAEYKHNPQPISAKKELL